uniref:Uncharacterized protein n=1 Tax=Anguilla anguilla TaxID=7936 RepID=A0A0E9W3F3_ANGAN
MTFFFCCSLCMLNHLEIVLGMLHDGAS